MMIIIILITLCNNLSLLFKVIRQQGIINKIRNLFKNNLLPIIVYIKDRHKNHY